MEQSESKKKWFLDGLEDNLMLIPLIVGGVITLAAFLARFISPEREVLFNQLAYYAFGWYVALVMATCVREKMYLKLDLVNQLLPAAGKKVLAVLNEILELIVICVIFVFSFKVVGQALSEGTVNAVAPQIPVAVAYFAPILGFGIAIVRKIERLLKEGIKA